MNRYYNWAYLCSDERRLKLTDKFLRAPLQGHRCICVNSDLDPSERIGAIFRTMNSADEFVSFCDLGHLSKICPPALRPYYTGNGKPRWALGMKLLIPYLITAPMLYTDDDVLICNEPWKLTENGTRGFGTGNFPFFKGNPKRQYLMDQLNEAFGTKFTADDYDANIMDAGIWFIPTEAQRIEWVSQLTAYAQMPYLKTLDPDSIEFRRQDQRFITMFGMKHGWLPLHQAKYRRNALSAPTPKTNVESLIKNTYFVHYLTGQFKQDWMRVLEEFQWPASSMS